MVVVGRGGGAGDTDFGSCKKCVSLSLVTFRDSRTDWGRRGEETAAVKYPDGDAAAVLVLALLLFSFSLYRVVCVIVLKAWLCVLMCQ